MRLAVTAAACALVALAAGCGGDEDVAESPGSDPVADLTVVVWPSGPDGPSRRKRIVCARVGEGAAQADCRGLAGLRPEQLAPVPANVACTQIYGGPALARVRGELRGRRVDARFELSNGCEIERWDRNRVLLDDAPRR